MDCNFSVQCGAGAMAGSKVKKAERPGETEVGEGKVKVRRSRDHQEASCGLVSQQE